jgi:hypothetical protein
MSQRLKVILSIVFVVIVALLVARGCIQKKPLTEYKLPPFTKKTTQPKVAPKKPKLKVATESPVVKKASKPEVTSKMAIILDDWGMNTSLIQSAIDLDRPITLAILPHLKHSRDIAESAKAHGLGVMLHMPMQPKNLRQPKERHTITTASTDEEIRDLLQGALASVPYVQGINNHQGSAATSDARVMKSVISYLKTRKLFFVDSNVIATTVGWKIARDAGLPYTKRDVFIDNEARVEAIKDQLKKAEDKALARGSVVVIGHDKRATLEAIKAMIPEIESKGIELVLVKELLQ